MAKSVKEGDGLRARGVRINIVTVCRNDSANLRRTFDSIRRCKLKEHRYYVVDGQSDDGTPNLLEEYADIIDGCLVEKDSGIYNAMNKIDRFEEIEDNDYLLWINAGDELIAWDESILMGLGECDCYFHSVITKATKLSKGCQLDPVILEPYSEKNYMPISVFRHQGFLIKVGTFRKYYYNTDVGINADGLLMYQCIVNEAFHVVRKPISVYYTNGISNREFAKALESYLTVYKFFGFSLPKLLFYQRSYFAKTILKMLLPYWIVEKIRFLKESRKSGM